jgi:hypothetical protein
MTGPELPGPSADLAKLSDVLAKTLLELAEERAGRAEAEGIVTIQVKSIAMVEWIRDKAEEDRDTLQADLDKEKQLRLEDGEMVRMLTQSVCILRKICDKIAEDRSALEADARVYSGRVDAVIALCEPGQPVPSPLLIREILLGEKA